MPTSSSHLTAPNLELDRSGLGAGLNSLPAGDYETGDVQPWDDSTLETIIRYFGHILNRRLKEIQPVHPTPVAEYLLRLIRKDSVQYKILPFFCFFP